MTIVARRNRLFLAALLLCAAAVSCGGDRSVPVTAKQLLERLSEGSDNRIIGGFGVTLEPLSILRSADPSSEVVGRLSAQAVIPLGERSENQNEVGGMRAYWYTIPDVGWVFGADVNVGVSVLDGLEATTLSNAVPADASAFPPLEQPSGFLDYDDYRPEFPEDEFVSYDPLYRALILNAPSKNPPTAVALRTPEGQRFRTARVQRFDSALFPGRAEPVYFVDYTPCGFGGKGLSEVTIDYGGAADTMIELPRPRFIDSPGADYSPLEDKGGLFYSNRYRYVSFEDEDFAGVPVTYVLYRSEDGVGPALPFFAATFTTDADGRWSGILRMPPGVGGMCRGTVFDGSGRELARSFKPFSPDSPWRDDL